MTTKNKLIKMTQKKEKTERKNKQIKKKKM